MGDLPPVIRSVQRSFVCRSAMVFYRAGRVGRPVAGTAFAELPGKINQLKPFVMKKNYSCSRMRFRSAGA